VRHWLQLFAWTGLTFCCFQLTSLAGAAWRIDHSVGLAVFLLLAAVALSQAVTIKSLASLALGLLVSSIGSDIESGESRLTFGFDFLRDGAAVLVGSAMMHLSVPALALERNLVPARLARIMSFCPSAIRRGATPVLVLWFCASFDLEPIIIPTLAAAAFCYFLLKLGFEPLPFVAAAILGLHVEEKLRQAALIHRGAVERVLLDPAAIGMVLAGVVLVLWVVAHKKRDEVSEE
jgi:TctA family transporter